MTVSAWPGIREGQAIWLICKGTKEDGSAVDDEVLRAPPKTVTSQEAIDGIRATIPLTYLNRLGDFGRLRIQMRAARDGDVKDANATEFPELVLDLPECVTVPVSGKYGEYTKPTAIPSAMNDGFGYVATMAAEGPVALSDKGTNKPIKVEVHDEHGAIKTIALRILRVIEMGDSSSHTPWDETYVSIRPATVKLNTYVIDDLPPGRYRGQTIIQLLHAPDRKVRQSLLLDIDITIPPIATK